MSNWINRILLILIAGCGLGFVCFRNKVGGDYLDTVFTENCSRKVLGLMGPKHKSAHIQVTLWIDMLFPVAYATLLARLAIGSKRFSWLAAPAILAMVTDFCENICHISILNDVEGLLTLKVILTNTKFALLGVAILIAIFTCRAERKKRTAGHNASDHF